MTPTITRLTDTHVTIGGAEYAYAPVLCWFLGECLERGCEVEIVVKKGVVTEVAAVKTSPASHTVPA